jgi:hypothetical protein
MQAAVFIALIAALISFISLMVAIISCSIAIKNYKKSKRLEFFQRRDELLQKIADLNAKHSEAHLISARLGIVLLNLQSLSLSLGLDERRTKENTDVNNQIASVKRLLEKINLFTSKSDEFIEELRSMCSSLTIETDEARIEALIARVQVASVEAKQHNEVVLSSVHTLESTNPMMKVNIAEMQRLEIRKAELDLERAITEFESEKAPN